MGQWPPSGFPQESVSCEIPSCSEPAGGSLPAQERGWTLMCPRVADLTGFEVNPDP